MDLSLSIQVVKDISEKDFKEKFFDPQIPVVIKGLTKDTFAGKHWNLDYFKETMGSYTIPIYDNKNANNGSAFTRPDSQMQFGEFIETIQKDEPSTIRIFLFNLFKLNPELKKEFPCPKLAQGILGNLGWTFFAGKNTTVRIHYDLDLSNVFHTHFCGRKRVVLFAPENNPLLYKLPFNTYSLIDIDKPDYEKYPALRYAKGYDFVLEDGNTLFMPSGYWHYMTYLDPSFSVSYRKITHPFLRVVSALFNVTIWLWLDKVMNIILNERWIEIKEKKAAMNAEKYVKRMMLSNQSFA